MTRIRQTSEHQYTEKYKTETQQQIHHPVYYERRQIGKAGNCRLHQRHIITHVIEQIVIFIADIIYGESYVCQQNDERQCLIFYQQHQDCRQTYDVYECRQIDQQKIAEETTDINFRTQFRVATHHSHSNNKEVEQKKDVYGAQHFSKQIFGIAERTHIKNLGRIELLIAFQILRS